MLLTIKEAADKLAVTPSHFRAKFVNTGEIEVIALGKGCKGDRIDPLDLEKLKQNLRKKRCHSTSVGKRGGSSFSTTVKQLDEALEHALNGKRKNSSAT